jgi:hypothetical protein
VDYVFGTDGVWDGGGGVAVDMMPEFPSEFPSTSDVLRDLEAGIADARTAPAAGGSVDYAALSNIFTATSRSLSDALRSGADVWAQLRGEPTTAQRDALFQAQLAQRQQQGQTASWLTWAALGVGAVVVLGMFGRGQ